jgi:hypothetical protein
MAPRQAETTPPLSTAAPASAPESYTKPFLWLSLAGAIAAATWGMSLTWPVLRAIVPAGFAVGWGVARVNPALARQVLLGVFYLVPATFMFSATFVPAGSWVVWMAPLCGVIVATTAVRRWALPDILKLPLAFWALVTAAAWPIIVLREGDFLWTRVHPATAWWYGIAAAATILGVLWLDALFAAFAGDDFPAASFERQIAWPLATGWALCSLFAIYQLFGDITFLNGGLWGMMQRARGTLADANPFGVMSALCGPVMFAVAVERWSGWRRIAGAAALPLSWLAVWASGSRSSLPIVALTLVYIIGFTLDVDKSRRPLRAAALAVVLFVVVGAGLVASRGSGVDSPFRRAVSTFGPRLSLVWLSETTARLQSRDGYGTLGSIIIRDYPFVGVGVGAFHDLVPMYAWTHLHLQLAPDNAQNWFRHQLAELGVIGSVGWIVWVAVFLGCLLFGRTTRARPLTAGVLRAALVGFGLISLVGMPGQDVAVVFTFWTMAFWFLRLLDPPGQRLLAWRAPHRIWWTAIWAVALGYTIATAYVARTDMRMPNRVAKADLDFTYGFYPPEQGGTVRWTRRQAVDVLPVPSNQRWLQLTVGVNHMDLPKNPVDVKVWVNQKEIVGARLSSIEPITRYVKVPDGDRRVVLETRVSRTVKPRDFGVPDDRELGLLVDCKFLDAPPPGSVP